MRFAWSRLSSACTFVAAVGALGVLVGAGNACLIPHESACSSSAMGGNFPTSGTQYSCDGNVLVAQNWHCDSDKGNVNDGAPTRTDCGATAACRLRASQTSDPGAVGSCMTLCTTDASCAADEFCQKPTAPETQSLCHPRARSGEQCVGDTSSAAYLPCGAGLTCVADPAPDGGDDASVEAGVDDASADAGVDDASADAVAADAAAPPVIAHCK